MGTVGGYCARPELAENFTKESYLGRWYEMYAGKTVPFEANKDCITATYADKDGTNIRVDNQSYRISDGSFSNWEDGTHQQDAPVSTSKHTAPTGYLAIAKSS